MFYHFSGFDSGAQKIMLDRYGSHSPVLFELRDWYIARCEELEQSTLSKIDCIYNRFSNGERITAAHRLLYRRRDDLMRAFPDPFAAHDPGGSYYHWYLADSVQVDEATCPAPISEVTSLAAPGEVTLLRRIKAHAPDPALRLARLRAPPGDAGRPRRRECGRMPVRLISSSRPPIVSGQRMPHISSPP